MRKRIKEPSGACGEYIEHSQYGIQNTKRAQMIKYFTKYIFFIFVLRTYDLVGRQRQLKCGTKLVATCRQSRPRAMWLAWRCRLYMFFEDSMAVIVTGGSTSLLRVSLTRIQPMHVVIRVMLFTLLQCRNYFGCQVAVKAYPTGSAMQGKNSNIGGPSSPLLIA